MAFLACVLAGWQDAKAQIPDTKTAKQIGENAAAAAASELLYKEQIDTTKMNRDSLLIKVSIRNVMKQIDLAARKVTGNFGREGAAYKMMCEETSLLMAALGKLSNEAGKHPGHLPDVLKDMAEIMAESKDLVTQSVKMAMGGKVENPFGNDGDGNDDGKNLLLQDERLAICNNTISRLRKLRMATEAAAFKLGCEYTWKDALRKTLGFHYYWALGMEESFRNTVKSLENAPWRR